MTEEPMELDPRDRGVMKVRMRFFATSARYWLGRLLIAQSYEEAEDALERFKQAQAFKKEYRRLANQAWVIISPEEGI